MISGHPEEAKSVPAEDIGSKDGASAPARTISFGVLAMEELAKKSDLEHLIESSGGYYRGCC